MDQNNQQHIDKDDNLLVVGSGFTIEGDVRGKGAVMIGGLIKGNVHAASIKLTESGQVFGHVECQQFDLSGKLHGSFDTVDILVRPQGSIVASVESRSSGTCLVAGTFNGNLKGNKVKVEANGNVVGSIEIVQIDVYGRVTGNIDGADVVVRNGALVEGDISYGELAMERGSDVSGQIQRKTHSNGKATKTEPLTSEVHIHLPLEAIKALRKNPPPESINLSLVDGSQLPEWITLDREHTSLVLQRGPFEALVAERRTMVLRLQMGSEVLTFSIPPKTH